MSRPPFEHAGSLRIGTVDFVSPDAIKVILDIDAPESIALNAGAPQPFPRINGYLLIQVEEGLLVGQVEWITVEHSPFPKRRGMRDFGLVDLPYPLRKLRLNPLGILQIGAVDGRHVFRRGANTLPSVGAAVLLPTETQLRSVVESGEHRRVKIGTSSMAGNAPICIDPNRLFGRHLAVLGNTGSGKSCSVAGLVRWSLEQSQHESSIPAHARFIILDPNGEYSRAFGNGGAVKTRVFKVEPGEGEIPLRVPLWFWNSAEWCSFTQASARTQRPLLRRALREVKAGHTGISESTDEEKKIACRRYLSSRRIALRRDLHSGAIQTDATKFGRLLEAIAEDLKEKKVAFPNAHLGGIQDAITHALQETFESFTKEGKSIEYYRPFTEALVTAIIEAFSKSIDSLGGIIYQDGPGENVPVPFTGAELADHIEIVANQENVSQYLDFLVARIRTLLSDPTLKAIIDDDTSSITLTQWLQDYIGTDDEEGGRVSVIDLSLVPAEVVHVTTAVIARLVFEALQRYSKLNGLSLPTVLVMEEAHTFIKRYREDSENQDAATVCCQVFERIAREGRKFGLGLVLSSQRPSELSPSVLSQCNSFLLHRISNDRDQELVSRLVPDNLRGLLRELPSLPSQNAVLLGWASELPVLVKMNDLPKNQQPRSDDPEFWEVWTRKESRTIDWNAIADDWIGVVDHPAENAISVDGANPESTRGKRIELAEDDGLPF